MKNNIKKYLTEVLNVAKANNKLQMKISNMFANETNVTTLYVRNAGNYPLTIGGLYNDSPIREDFVEEIVWEAVSRHSAFNYTPEEKAQIENILKSDKKDEFLKRTTQVLLSQPEFDLPFMYTSSLVDYVFKKDDLYTDLYAESFNEDENECTEAYDMLEMDGISLCILQLHADIYLDKNRDTGKSREQVRDELIPILTKEVQKYIKDFSSANVSNFVSMTIIGDIYPALTSVYDRVIIGKPKTDILQDVMAIL